MSRATVSQETRQAARNALLEVLHDGDTVYTVLRSVSRSGMSRNIDLYFLKPETKRIRKVHDGYDIATEVIPLWLSNNASMVLNGKYLGRDRDGIRVNGCGMDMGYYLVSSLATELGISLTQRWL